MKRFSLLLIASLFTPTVFADITGAGDAALIAKMVEQIKELQKQYKVLDKTYKNAESQLDSVNRLAKFNSGHSGFGRLHNSLADMQKRQSANTWRETLKGVAGGNPERYSELVKAYERQHEHVNKATFSKGATQARTSQFEETREVTQAASVESEAAFNDINESLKRIHDLSDQIEKAENTKAAIDLNSRLLAEVAYLQTQNLKAQAILNQQMASKSGSNLADDTALAEFLTLEKGR